MLIFTVMSAEKNEKIMKNNTRISLILWYKDEHE